MKIILPLVLASALGLGIAHADTAQSTCTTLEDIKAVNPAGSVFVDLDAPEMATLRIIVSGIPDEVTRIVVGELPPEKDPERHIFFFGFDTSGCFSGKVLTTRATLLKVLGQPA